MIFWFPQDHRYILYTAGQKHYISLLFRSVRQNIPTSLHLRFPVPLLCRRQNLLYLTLRKHCLIPFPVPLFFFLRFFFFIFHNGLFLCAVIYSAACQKECTYGCPICRLHIFVFPFHKCLHFPVSAFLPDRLDSVLNINPRIILPGIHISTHIPKCPAVSSQDALLLHSPVHRGSHSRTVHLWNPARFLSRPEYHVPCPRS